MTKSVTHCHKNPTGKHHYGTGAAKPAVDVSALQRKLKAKGYYKGAIDGVINNDTRDALKKYQNR
ncbi:MAG TPA: peptidoglycan-binding protein [Thiothrix sp.]|nr:peptidoglycan-binding protein [Thiothrix sp.]